jgi:hypothetical protein
MPRGKKIINATAKLSIPHKISLFEEEQETKINSDILELADRLSKNQACVMVGAGFSKNAESLGSKTKLPSWVDLGEPFYKKLNCDKSPPHKITDASEVQELAANIEKEYERQVLDQIIEKEIPDNEFRPSALHIKLLEFPWRDIYTTNYDTLLERASSGNFATITNQNELRLSSTPRIIKLHGSFPSSKPYIITKKDFELYPKKYKFFVTHIKNALIETMFCLIGFSGNDPNFLNWINWLKKASDPKYPIKIYFFGVEISEDDKKSLNDKNIRAIDISIFNKVSKYKISPDPSGTITHSLTIDDYKRAYTKFFDSLSECLNIKRSANITEINPSAFDWPEKKHMFQYPEKDVLSQCKEAIENWKSNRIKYPGWIILSESRRAILRDFTESSFIYDLNKLENFMDIQFLYEFNWRTEKYLYPLFDDRANIYKKTLDKYNPFPKIFGNGKGIIPKRGDGIDWNEIRIYWIELHFTLLKYYRQKNMVKYWQSIAKKIEKIKLKLNNEQDARYHYERCLFQLFSLDIQLLRKELTNWKVSKKLPFWESKRAALIAELGDVSEALGIIKLSLKKIECLIKTEKSENNYALFSQQAYILDLLDYVQRSFNFAHGDWSWNYKGHDTIYAKIKELKKYECVPWDDLDYFDTVLKFVGPDYKHNETIYGFELNSIFSNEYYGSDVYTIKAYSYLHYMEETGFPFKLPGVAFSNYATKQSIKRLYKFSPLLSLITLIRAGEEKCIENVFSRKIISKMTNDYANNLSNSLLKILKKSKNEITKGDRHTNLNLGISISSVLPEILGRLCLKTSFSVRKELLTFLKAVYSSEDRYKYEGLPKLMKYLVKSFSTAEQYELINIFLDFPILPDNLRYKFPDPFSFIDLENVKRKKTTKISTARVKEAIKYAEENNEKREKAIFRLLVLWRYQLLTKSQIKRFASVLWKYTNEDGFPSGAVNHFYYSAFLWFPYPSNIKPEIIYREYISKIQFPIQSIEKKKSIAMTYGNIMFFGNIIGTFNSKYVYKWSREELYILIDKVADWWNADKNYLKEGTENNRRAVSIRDEFKARFNNMLSIFACIFQPNIDIIEKDYISKIIPILSELKEHNIPDIMARASFIKYFPNTIKEIITNICDALYSKDEDIIPDAIAGTMVLLRQKCKGMNRIVRGIGENIKGRTTLDLHRFLLIMNTIVSDYPEYINNAILADVGFGLKKLAMETKIDDECTDKNIHTRQICRKHSAGLALALKKYYQIKKVEIPDYITEWEKVINDVNEVVEIRNIWIP